MQMASMPAVVPATWAEFTWPDWVPEAVRRQIEGDGYGGPAMWLDGAVCNQAPALGERVTLPRLGVEALVTGRFVFAWSNIARVVRDDGTWVCTWFSPVMIRDPDAYRQQELNKVRERMATARAHMAELEEQEAALAGPPP